MFNRSMFAASGRAVLTSAAIVALVFALAPVANAGGVGFDVAYISPEGFDGTFGVGGFFTLDTGMTNLQIEPFAGYWSRTEGMPGDEASLSDLTLGARGKYNFNLPSAPVQPYIGVGAGLHFLKAGADFTLGGQTSNLSVTDSEFGLDVGGGISIPVSPAFSLRGEGWYSFVGSTEWASARIGAQFTM